MTSGLKKKKMGASYYCYGSSSMSSSYNFFSPPSELILMSLLTLFTPCNKGRGLMRKKEPLLLQLVTLISVCVAMNECANCIRNFFRPLHIAMATRSLLLTMVCILTHEFNSQHYHNDTCVNILWLHIKNSMIITHTLRAISYIIALPVCLRM